MVNEALWPDRIKMAFIKLQYQSEFIVAAVQLAVITLLFTILIFAPINYSPDAPIHCALLGLSLFCILVLVRLWFAYTQQLTPWLLGSFVVMEMVLLLFTIGTYNLQFEDAPSIILKNSHINYLFILIALRALRFEPRWVILSGITATVGWIIMVGYVFKVEGMKAMTWDYVTYASSRSIYLGVEFDKILSIAIVTMVIAFAIKRAQNILRQAVVQSFAAKDLGHFFDKAVARKITCAERDFAPGQGEIQTAVIMFVDLRGFSKLSEKLSTNALLEILGEYQQLLVPIIQKHQGSIDKFMGDGILASFGAVIPSKTFAADALNAVDDIMLAVNQWKAKQQERGNGVDIGMGLAMGEILIGAIGHEDRLEFTVIGEAVNLAAKLEKHNKVEKVHALATHQLFECAIKQGYLGAMNKEIRTTRTVAGVDQKVDLVVLA